MIRTRYTAVVVDKDRKVVSDHDKELFPYERIPFPRYKFGVLKYPDENVILIKCIANDLKRLQREYISQFVNRVNEELSQVEANWRVYGKITPDFRYKIVKYTVIPKGEKANFDNDKAAMLSLLEKYQQAAYASGDYEAINDATLEPSIIDSIEAPYGSWIGYIRSAGELFVIDDTLLNTFFSVQDKEIIDNSSEE